MNLSPSDLLACYRAGNYTVLEVAEFVLQRQQARDQEGVWVSTVPAEQLLARARALDARRHEIDQLPLFGLPFNVKDCIDVAGEHTTAACPEFAYKAKTSSPAVERILAAGALYVGKTNMDQFATGLVGTRSPYGIPRNPYNPDYISGGSSSGTAVSVATGSTSFGLGTDTGGSGRVPAAYCGVTGLKPAPGAVSRRSMVAACRSFDTISVYTPKPNEAYTVLEVMAGFDAEDPFSNPDYRLDRYGEAGEAVGSLRVMTIGPEQREFFGNTDMAQLFESALEHVAAITGACGQFDYQPLKAVGDLMFFGPFAAERDVSVGDFLEANPHAGEAVVRKVILESRRYLAKDAYAALYQVHEARRLLDQLWRDVDVVMLPTVGTQYRIEEVLADPLTPNFNNGYYTNFANPLGLAGIAVPCGCSRVGLPFGITFYGPAGSEARLTRLAAAIYP